MQRSVASRGRYFAAALVALTAGFAQAQDDVPFNDDLAKADLSRIDLSADRETLTGSVSLVPWLLVIVFGILTYLILVEAYLTGDSS